MKLTQIVATTIPDAWFQCLWEILDHGRHYQVGRGSFEGQHRMEFDHVTVQIRSPIARPLLPEIPVHMGIPNPVADGYVEEYLPYLMTDAKHPGEDYTYGSRLCLPGDQIQYWIDMLRLAPDTNQAILQVAQPSDCVINSPPCLRHIDLRIQDGALHFFPYFRSWDLWGGFPANLAAIQLLKEYMASEIGVNDGEMIATSKGLHLYDHVWRIAMIRTLKGD